MQACKTDSSPIINWLEEKLKEIATTVEQDAEKAIKNVRGQIADYIDKNAQVLADKVKDAIEKAGGSIEAEIGKIGTMIGTDIDQAIQTTVTDVCKFLGIDSATAQKIESEIQAEVDTKVSTAVTKIENNLKNFVDHGAAKIDTDIANALHDLASKIRG